MAISFQAPISPLKADLNFNTHKGTNVSDPTNPQDIGTKNYIDQAISAISSNTSGVISGCGVAWSGTGLQFIVSAGTYSINGTSYSVPQSTVTLDAADGANPRIDLIIVTNTSTATKITGTPAANPVAPAVDPSSQLQLTFITVAAGAGTPGVTNTLIYDENAGDPTEWNSSSSGSTWDLASTNNPFSGSKDIEATSVGSSAYAQLQKGSGALDPSAQNSLVFYIRSKAAWAANRALAISLRNSGAQVGSAVTLRDGVYGFSSSVTASYQQIVIPITAFAAGNANVNQVRFAVSGSGASIGFYLDFINFQSGVNAANQNFLTWQGSWASANSYVRNNVVTYNGIGYVCLVANVNSAPSPSNSNWQSFGNPIRTIGFTLDGGGRALSTGKVKGFYTCPVAGKITGYSIGADAGTATIKTWKVATGTAVPTASNNISTSGVSLATGTYIRSTTVSDFTSTTVTATDIFAFNLTAVGATTTELTFQLEITPQ